MSSRFDDLFRFFRLNILTDLPKELDPKKVLFSYKEENEQSLFKAYSFSNTRQTPCLTKVNPGEDVVRGTIWFTVDRHTATTIDASCLVEFMDEYRDTYYIDPNPLFWKKIIGSPTISGF